MPARVCSRCKHTNPEGAAFCYFDGALLQAAGNGTTVSNQLTREFVFPSGRRCKNFDDFAAGCQEEWAAARDLLRQGMFQKFFANMGRADLARAAQDAMGQADGDFGLNSFLGVLPVSRTFQPRLDVNPRRLAIGPMTVGEIRRVQLTITNQGQGQLQGTLKVSEGDTWLSFSGQATSCAISTAREQKVLLEISAAKLVALQSFGGKLTAVTNGGIVEIPIRVDVVSKPFGKVPFADAKTPREMAERMRKQPKSAGPLLESGEVLRWFASNNWNYPVQGQLTKGIASVQQFFEAMGLSKPPILQVSQAEVRFRYEGGGPVRFQVLLSTPSRKWVYAWISSDQPWLKVLTPHVNGPQKATISFEVDGRVLPRVRMVQATLTVAANAGQKLPIRVLVESPHAPASTAVTPLPSQRQPSSTMMSATPVPSPRQPSTMISATPLPSPRPIAVAATPRRSLIMGMLAMALAFFLVRLALMPLVDFWLYGAEVRMAAAKLNVSIAATAPVARTGGWLRLPWTRVLLGSGALPTTFFEEEKNTNPEEKKETRPVAHDGQGERKMEDFRHYFVQYLTRDLILYLWWLGPVLAVVLVRRRGGGWIDLPWALVAGSAGGVIGSASLSCVFLMVEAVPHVVWDVVFSAQGNSVVFVVWLIVALVLWTAIGAVLGLVCGLIRPLEQTVVAPVRDMLAGGLRLCRLRGLARKFATEG